VALRWALFQHVAALQPHMQLSSEVCYTKEAHYPVRCPIRTTLNQRLWSWLRNWRRSWLSSWLSSLLVCPSSSLSRRCPGSISSALTRTGKLAANLAVASTCIVLTMCTFVEAVGTSASLIHRLEAPQAFAPTWAHASESRRRTPPSKDTMRRYIEIAGICTKGHSALHLEPMLRQHNI
jgi:hypothetical protein